MDGGDSSKTESMMDGEGKKKSRNSIGAASSQGQRGEQLTL